MKKIINNYEDFQDKSALIREKKKKPKMIVKSAFLKQINKIKKNRYEKKYSG